MNKSNFYQTRINRSLSVPGSTGVLGRIEESKFDNPIRIENDRTIWYHVENLSHCAFAPAVSNTDTERWFIEGIELVPEEVTTIKSILADIKLAPMYLNDPLYKYTAKHMLKLPPTKY